MRTGSVTLGTGKGALRAIFVKTNRASPRWTARMSRDRCALSQRICPIAVDKL